MNLRYHNLAEIYQNLAALQGNIWVFDGAQLILARSFGIIDRLPKMSEEGLDDRNKGDILMKFITLFQITWLIVQLIVRKVRDLPSSQLEVVTLAFAACTIITYLLLIKKPQDSKHL